MDSERVMTRSGSAGIDDLTHVERSKNRKLLRKERMS